MELGKALTLQNARGGRSQLTIIVGAVLNLLVGFGFINITPEDLAKVNEALLIVFAYFMADKVSDIKKPEVPVK